MTNPRVEVEIARRYLVACSQSFCHNPVRRRLKNGGYQPQGWGITKDTSMEKMGETQSGTPAFWNTLPARILTASPHLQGYDVPGKEIDRLKAEGLTLVEALEMLGM